MTRFSLFLGLLLFIVACKPQQQVLSTATPTNTNLTSQQLATLIQEYEKQEATAEAYAKNAWPRLDTAFLTSEKEWLSSLKNRLARLQSDQLSPAENISRDILLLLLEDRVFHLEFESHLFPLNSEGGFLTSIIYNIQFTPIPNAAAFQAYRKKLQQLPTYFAARQASMQKGQAQGKSSPKLIVQNCINLIDHFLKTPSDQTFYSKPVKGQVAYEQEIEALIEKSIFPAYRNFRKYLAEEYLVQAPEAIGISSITDGKAFYQQRVQYFTTYDISPEEVFATGQAEVKRIRAEMEAIIADLNFKGSFADFLHFLRTDPQFYPQTGEELLHKAAWITKEMEGELPKYFGKLPRMPLTVKPVPDALAPNYTSGRYSPGSYQQKKAGQYWVNTYQLESRPYYVLPALSLHEGVPGHHLQIMLAAEIEGVPNFQKATYLSAYGEGWGLYAEFLGKEVGIYHTPYEHFGRLTYEMWRACRLVVDPGMHYMGWTRQEAYDFMLQNTALSEHEVNTEIDRYIGWPGQAVSYKIGELKIRALRQKAEESLGAQFDIRAFHDKILENGSVPLYTLERIIDRYIEETK